VPTPAVGEFVTRLFSSDFMPNVKSDNLIAACYFLVTAAQETAAGHGATFYFAFGEQQ
jgi:hypothetical protein